MKRIFVTYENKYSPDGHSRHTNNCPTLEERSVYVGASKVIELKDDENPSEAIERENSYGHDGRCQWSFLTEESNG